MIIATHNGKFHADDVFGVTLLKQLYPEAEVWRTRDEDRLARADIVLDVGGVFDPEHRRFDHHQLSSGARENGILYSAFGLLWQHYGLEFCGGNEEVRQRIDDRLVQAIDAVDNGQEIYTLTEAHAKPYDVSALLGLFNPLTMTDGEPEEFDEQFSVAVGLATQVLLRLRAKVADEVAAEDFFLEAYRATPDKRYVVLDRFVPSGRISSKQAELLYVVFPNANGDWAIQTVRAEAGRFESRKLLPEAWRGLRDGELAGVAGVPDAVFCHKAGFIAAARSRESALAMLGQALEA